MNIFHKTTVYCALTVAGLTAAIPVSAESLLTVNKDNEIFFVNFENVFDANGHLKGPGTPLEVDDHIVGIINIQNIDVDGSTSWSWTPGTDELSGIIAQRIVAILPPPDPYDASQTSEPHVVLGPPAVTTFCEADGTNCFNTGLTGNEMLALYHDEGATQFESNGPMADDVAKATNGTAWVKLGHNAGADNTYGTGDEDGYIYSHTDGAFPPPDEAYAALNATVNNTGVDFGQINDLNEDEIGGQNLLFTDMILTSELEINPNFTLGISPWATRSNDPATVFPFEIGGEACRVTGGGNDIFVDENGHMLTLWNGTLENAKGYNLFNGNNLEEYSFGGQAGASTALPPQPSGEWTHRQRKGRFGQFTFHGGTASAPQGTEIIEIRCSDPGYCRQARPAPTKQIDFDGIGTFKNIGDKGNAVPTWLIAGANVTDEGSGNTTFDGTFHFFTINIDDGGEPGNENSADKKNPKKGDTTACPVDGFGENGSVALVDCDCPDFYRIRIHDGVNAVDVSFDADGNINELALLKAQPVIYEVYGYIDGGNLQIHPPTGKDLKLP